MKVKVTITKNYYKGASIDMEIPDDVLEEDYHEYLYSLDWKTSELTDELSNGNFNAAGDMEIECVETMEPIKEKSEKLGEFPVEMKAADYKVGDKCLFLFTGTRGLSEIVVQIGDLVMIEQYEGTAFEGYWYRALKQ